MHLRTSRRLHLKGGNRSSLWTLTSPQSHIEKVRCDRNRSSVPQTDGRTDTEQDATSQRGRRATRTKRQNHRRSHRKLERVNRERSQLESAPSPVALEHGFFQVLIRRGSANTASAGTSAEDAFWTTAKPEEAGLDPVWVFYFVLCCGMLSWF